VPGRPWCCAIVISAMNWRVRVGTWSTPPRAAPRTDPSVRDYRTGLLAWIRASRRWEGQGCLIWAGGIH
jgi:hypothetical protein